uniref:Protein binding protein n=1 Tax=Rhizophora mucronata TaxID=61149 RepID=A0A2P2K243_RHIMU
MTPLFVLEDMKSFSSKFLILPPFFLDQTSLSLFLSAAPKESFDFFQS